MTAHRQQAKKFYDSIVWKDLRMMKMDMENHCCEHCGDAAYIVHHKEWIDIDNITDPSVTLNIDNLEALCLSCHNTVTFRTNQSTQNGLTFDMYGNLIQHK